MAKKTDVHVSRKLETRRKKASDKENEKEKERKKDGESAVSGAQIERQQKGECIM